MTRRLFLIVPAVIVALLLTVSAQTPADEVSLVILHTNDTHGHLLPFSYPSIVPVGSELAALPVRRDIGGIARRAAMAAAIRAGAAARGSTVWLVDVGDFMDGTPFSTEYKGHADVAAMNAAGYQFGTIGNHEFNMPLAALVELIKKPAYPLVLANATVRATGQPLLPAYRIERVGPVKVAVFGLVTRESQSYPAAREGVDIADVVATATALVPKLRAEADIVALLSHCGDDVDQRLAADVPGIDVIIGGHSHSRLPSGSLVWHRDDLRSDSVGGTVIAQAHQWGGELGRLDLLFRRDASGAWRVARYRARLIPVTSSIKSDPKVAEVVDRFWQPIASRYGEVIGTAADDFSARGDDEAPYALVADAVRETFGAEFGLENTGGVRAPLVAGPITRADLVMMDPFDNTVIQFKATGRRLKALLERYAPYPSGLRYRIVDGTVVEATIGGKPLEDDREYTGVTNSYLAGFALKDLTLTDTKRGRLEVVTEYIRKHGTVRPAYDGRRVVIGSLRRESR